MDNTQTLTHDEYLKLVEENARLKTENEMLKQTRATKVTVKVVAFDIDLPTPPNSSQKRPLKSEATDNKSIQKKPKLELIGVVLPARKQSGAVTLKTTKKQASTRESTRSRSSSACRNAGEPLLAAPKPRVSISPGPGDTDSESDFGEEMFVEQMLLSKMDIDIPAPTAAVWTPRPDCFEVCRHTCPHLMPRQSPLPEIQSTYIYVKKTTSRGSNHTDPKNNAKHHPHCTPSCPEYDLYHAHHADRVRSAQPAEIVRAIIHYAQGVHANGGHVRNARLQSWLEDVNNGRVFQNAWMDLWNAAPTLPRLIDSFFPDGALGPPFDSTWAQTGKQYEDLPTHIDRAVRQFDLKAAQVGEPAFGPETALAAQPVILGHPTAAPAVPVTTPHPIQGGTAASYLSNHL